MSDIPENLEDMAKRPPENMARRPTGKILLQETQTDTKIPADITAYPSVNETFGGVKIERLYRTGGMSLIYIGTDAETGQPTLLKMLHSELLKDKTLKSRFKQEGEMTLQLNHANITRTLRAGEENGIPFIVFEFFKSMDLSDALKPECTYQLTPEDSASILMQVTAALIYAHSNKVIHRDIKPGNIIIDNDLHARIIDWGISKNLGNYQNLTIQEGLLGSPAYSSPEQLEDAASVTEASDVYSLGCTAYHLFSRTLPQEKSTSNYEAILSDRRNLQTPFELWLNEAIEQKRKDLTLQIEQNPAEKEKLQKQLEVVIPVSDELENLIMSILNAKKPSNRPTFETIIEDLETLIKQNKIRRQELTPEQQAEREKQRIELKEQIKSLKDTKGYREDIAITFQLAKAEERLAEISPRNTDEKAEYVQASLHDYIEVSTKLKVSRERLTDTEVGYLGETIKRLTELDYYEQARKQHREAKISEKANSDRLDATLVALKENDIEGIVNNYGKIDDTRIPVHLKSKRDNTTALIELFVQSIIDSGTSAVNQEKLEKAKEIYERAKKVAQVLPDKSKGKEQTAEFYRNLMVAEIVQAKKGYHDAREKKDYFAMYEFSLYLKNKTGEIPAELKEDVQGIFEQSEKELEPKNVDITLMRGLIDNAKSLQSKVQQELNQPGEEEVTEESIRSLPEDRIKEYDNLIYGIIKKFNSISKENIGPEYEEFGRFLEFFKGDVRAERLKIAIEKGNFTDKVKAYAELICYYEEHGNTKMTDRYISRAVIFYSKRLNLKKP